MRKPLESQWVQDMLAGGPASIPLGAPGEGWQPKCPTCLDDGYVEELRPYVVGGQNWGQMPQRVPCPACSSVCSTCEDRGIVRYDLPVGHPDFGKLFPCPKCKAGAEMNDKMQASLLTTANLPVQYKRMTFKSWDKLTKKQREGKRLARAAAGLFVEAAADQFYVERSAYFDRAGRTFTGEDARRNSLVFQGPVGLGKTGLAAAIANALAGTHTHQLRYIRARDVVRLVQRTYQKGYDGPHGDEVLGEIAATPVLILDEFNLAKDSEDRADIMETLIRHRYGNLLPTVITLNFTRDEAESEWGIRTTTALNAMAHWLVMGGEPLRNEGEEEEAW